jgi:hypothetical protein
MSNTFLKLQYTVVSKSTPSKPGFILMAAQEQVSFEAVAGQSPVAAAWIHIDG